MTRSSSRPGRLSSSPRILVIYKKSTYQRLVKERKNSRAQELLERKDRTVSRWMAAHEDHVQTIEEARSLLERIGVKAEFRYRSDADRAEEFDLVVTLGGDGTLLWASHLVGAQPMLAINTAPEDSVGYFCAATKHDMEEVVLQAIEGDLRSTRLTRMEFQLDSEVISSRVLNDVLFCHGSPAATTRYIIEHRGIEEEQRSSGIWIGPAAGSTAAQHSAGGKVLPPKSKRLQFVVREPYAPPGVRYALTRGLIETDEQLRLVSKIHGGRVYVDGPNLRRDVDLGSELILRRSSESLTVLGFRSRDGRAAGDASGGGRPASETSAGHAG